MREATAATPDAVDDRSSTVSDARTRLEVLYGEAYGPSVRLAQLLVGDRARAEELTQDAFVRVHGRIADLDEPAAYLRTVLVNLCRDAGRRRSRFQRLPEPRSRTVEAPSVPTDATEVWQALQALPDRQRIALVLRFYLDRPTDEIAEVLGVRPATVRSLVHRGLTTLKEVVPHD